VGAGTLVWEKRLTLLKCWNMRARSLISKEIFKEEWDQLSVADIYLNIIE
jgi:hypothetical protein